MSEPARDDVSLTSDQTAAAQPPAPASDDWVDLADRASGYPDAAAKVKTFPQTPGVYLMKDDVGRVIYVGKAKNLRSRAGSYFLKAAAEERRTAELVREISDIDFLDADSEVDALLMEARLIKDTQPKFNTELRDDKTFPYLEITTREDFPRVAFTREPSERGTKLYGPFASAGSLRRDPGVAADLQVSHLRARHTRK
ncbi:MAG: GIY-YIG nuclease family protein [Pirellulales bacterium]